MSRPKPPPPKPPKPFPGPRPIYLIALALLAVPLAACEEKTSAPGPKPGVKPSAVSERFADCSALRAVYPEGVPSQHPAYRKGLDRNRDGRACEE